VYDNLGTSVSISGNTLAAGSPYANNNGLQAGAVYVFIPAGINWTSTHQIAKLDASDPVYLGKLGYSVAIQGNTIVAGEYDGVPGHVYVFVKSGAAWQNAQQTAKLSATNSSEYLGYSVALSGNTIVAGAPGTRINGVEMGAAFVFVEPATGWIDMNQTAELTASSGETGDDVGYSVVLQGNTAIVGDPGDTLVGKGLVFSNESIIWRSMVPTAILSE
jgi:FG-GAP repeat